MLSPGEQVERRSMNLVPLRGGVDFGSGGGDNSDSSDEDFARRESANVDVVKSVKDVGGF